MWQMSRWDEGLGQRAVLRESERPCGALLLGGSGETSNAGASQEVHLCKDNNQPEGGPGVGSFRPQVRTAWSGEVGALGGLQGTPQVLAGWAGTSRLPHLTSRPQVGIHQHPSHLHVWARLSQSPLSPRPSLNA